MLHYILIKLEYINLIQTQSFNFFIFVVKKNKKNKKTVKISKLFFSDL